MPVGLIVLENSGNRMSGDIPSFPPTLEILGLAYDGWTGNYFSGTARLNRPIRLYINETWITDVVIQDTSVLTTSDYRCNLDLNPPLGNPNIVNLTMCTQNRVYSVELLPVTRRTSEGLTSVTASMLGTFKSMITSQLHTSLTTEINLITTLSLYTTTAVSSTMGPVLFVQLVQKFTVSLETIHEGN